MKVTIAIREIMHNLCKGGEARSTFGESIFRCELVINLLVINLVVVQARSNQKIYSRISIMAIDFREKINYEQLRRPELFA